MKEFFLFYYIGLLTMFLLPSCSEIYDPTTNTGVHQNELGYLSVAVDLPLKNSSFTRGISDAENDDTYVGTDSEQKVSSARIVLYDANDMVVHMFDITEADIAVGSFSATPFIVKARYLKKEVFDVLVLLNPTEKVKAVTGLGSTKSHFEVVAKETVDNLALSSRGIFMCNANGYVKTTDDNWRTSQLEAEAAGVPVSVKVERAVAKVFVLPAAGTTIYADGALGNVAKMNCFGLDIINKEIYWMRHPAKAITEHGTLTKDATVANESEQLHTMYYYATDPNMDNITVKDPIRFWYYNEGNAYKTSQGGFDDSRGLYVTENTMNADAQRGLGSTRVLFNIIYVPAELQSLASAKDKSWANYKGKILTLVELKEKFIEAQTMSDAQMQMPAGFKAASTSLKAKDYSSSFDCDGLLYYHNGENYYSTYIRHFDDMKQPKPMAYGRYGVVRNHVYKILVSKILGPGTPTPPTPEDTPNDKQATYVDVDIKVSPWNIRHQGIVDLN